MPQELVVGCAYPSRFTPDYPLREYTLADLEMERKSMAMRCAKIADDLSKQLVKIQAGYDGTSVAIGAKMAGEYILAAFGL